MIPVRITLNRTDTHKWESPKGLFCQTLSTRILGCEEAAIQLKKVPNIFETERRLGIAEPLQYTFDPLIDVLGGLG